MVALAVCLFGGCQNRPELHPVFESDPFSNINGQVDTPAHALDRVFPKYPALMVKYGVEGEVEFSFTVTKDATVTNITILHATDQSFAEAAKIAIIHQQYIPAISHRGPVDFRLTNSFTFTIRSTSSP
jgi:TonB family protein